MARAPQTLKTSKSVEKDLAAAEGTSTLTAIQRKGAELLRAVTWRSAKAAQLTKEKTFEMASDPRTQVTAASAASGAVVVGAGSASAGLLMGGLLGGAVGILPAFLTFGLSIPLCAVIGGGCGLVVGGAAGGTAGLVGTGAAGYGAYSKRVEIRSLIARFQAKLREAYSKGEAAAASAKTKASNTYTAVKGRLAPYGERAAVLLGVVMQRTAVAKAKAVDVASDKATQVTAASAAGGAVFLGTGGATAGLLAGGAAGAAMGIVPAIFTFGLSIPIGAVLGGGCGLAAGAATGSATGAVVGGVGGYRAFAKREAICSSFSQTLSRLDGAAAYVKERASDSAGHVRARLVGATGGTTE